LPYQFEWRRPEQEADEIIFRNDRKHGCHIVGIPDDKRGPGWAFSVGLFANYCHAELIVFGLHPDDQAGVINDVRDRVAAGRSYAAGDVCDDLLVDSRACFVEVPLQAYQDYLGTAIWFYAKSPRPFPCLQIVWPDLAGRFPWEVGGDERFKRSQPVLRSFSCGQ
jgi:hypothetical protein